MRDDMSTQARGTKPKSEEDDYFKEWYAENGDELNKSRKRRYADDPTYREKVLEQNREARKRRRQEQLIERKKENSARKVRLDRSWKTRPMTLTLEGGQQVTVPGFTIGAVAQVLGCSVQAIRLWEKKGVLPATEFRYAGRDRLYTWEQIEVYRRVLVAQDKLNPNKTRPRPLRMAKRWVKFSNSKTPRVTELYRIGVLARAANRTVVTLEQLEQRGYLPETPFRASELGYRLYTEDMIQAVSSALEARFWEVRGEEEWKKFHDEVHAAWDKEGVIGASILDMEVPDDEDEDEPKKKTAKPKAKKPKKK